MPRIGRTCRNHWTAPVAVAVQLVVFFSNQIVADTETPVVRMGPLVDLNIEAKPGMNVSGKRLRGARFVGQALQGANFDDCDLTNVQFSECNLTGATFRRANLTDVDMNKECPIDGADFTDAVINGLQAYLNESQLKSTWSYKSKDLRNCRISAADAINKKAGPTFDFKDAQLQGAIFPGGDYRKCNFTDARIDGAGLSGIMNFEQVASTWNHKRRRLNGVRFSIDIRGPADFRNQGLSRSNFFTGILKDADFSGAKIHGSYFRLSLTADQLISTDNYVRGELHDLKLNEIDLRGITFDRCNLSLTSFSDCDLTGVSFRDAEVSYCSFARCKGLTMSQLESTWNFKHDRMDSVRIELVK